MDFHDRIKHFQDLINSHEINLLLEMDVCNTLVDKFHLIAVFLYFSRAGLSAEEYTVNNFCLALFLNHEVYEEVEFYQIKIMKFCLGRKAEKCKYIKRFLDDRFKFFERMEFNTLTDIKVCNNLLRLMEGQLWTRKRRDEHCGIIKDQHKLCVHCGCPVI